MTQYKLNYFNLRGRGEVVRLVFVAAGQQYQDNRIEFDQWPQVKPIAPFGQLPWLEIHDGNQVTHLPQSITIARYLARKFGLAGKNELETALIESYGDQITDLQNEIVDAFMEKEEPRKTTLNQKLANETLPHNLKIIDERLAKSGSGFLASSGLSWADLHLFNVLEFLGDRREQLFANFKNIKALDQKIRAHPNIAAWLAKRPITDH